jgi:hypothetical protein
MLTVTRLLKPVIVTSHLLGGMSTLALLAVLVLRAWTPACPAVAGRPEPAGGARAAGPLHSDRPRRLGQQQLRRRHLRRFPTCQGSWWPEMDTHHAFTLDRELGATASGALLSSAALTAIHWTHRLFAGLVLVLAGGFGLRLLARTEPASTASACSPPCCCRSAWALPTCCCNCPWPWPSPTTPGRPYCCAPPWRPPSGSSSAAKPASLTGGGFTRHFQAVR